MENNIRLLSTSALPQYVVDDAKKNGVGITTIPFIDTLFLRNAALEQEIKNLSQQHTFAIFTSANAVNAVKELAGLLQAAWDVYCIGFETLNKVQELFNNVNIAAIGDNANNIAWKIIGHDIKEVTFFCSNIRMNHLPELLRESGIKVNEIIVYETKEMPQAIDNNFDGILFASPSAVRSFFKNNTVLPQTVLFSIGITTAAAIKQHTNNTIVISSTPSKQHLANEAVDYLKQTKK